MEAYVDQDMCIGCGICAAMAPDVFEMTNDGKAKVIADDVTDFEDAAKESADSCPAGAITVD